MTEAPWRTWIAEALEACGGSASPLAVAKAVWARHERDLRTGDLLYTWQLDLRAAAESMAADGRLRVADSGDWIVGAAGIRARGSWEAQEIAAVVAAYVEMLGAEHAGQPVRRREVVAGLVTSTGRPVERVEALLSNISHVVQEHDLTPLSSSRPSSNVPAGVRGAVAAALAGTVD